MPTPSDGTTGILVGGESLVSDIPLPVEDPATCDVVRTVHAADEGLVNAAVDAAADTVYRWSGTQVRSRQKALAALGDAIEARCDELARVLTLEQGKPLAEARREVLGAARTYRYYAGLRLAPERVRDDERGTVTANMEHVGVCALLLPWNYPVSIMSWKLAPCLLAGNTAVVKPAGTTPLADGMVAAMADKLLPPGTVNVVSGGDEVGKTLVAHPAVDKVSLTGSVATGRSVAEIAGRDLKHISLELGGNDPAVVFGSVRPERVASRLLRAAMRNAGQVCVAVKRLYLHEDVADAVLEHMVEEARTMVVGPGIDPTTQMGPLNNRSQLERVMSLVDKARDEGGKVVCGGTVPDVAGHERGLFYTPTLVTGLEENGALVAQEQFGPVLPVQTFSDEDEVLAKVNGTRYGLGTSVWDSDIEHAKAFAARIRAGTVWVNAHAGIDEAAPFGGMGISGVGREHGRWGLESYVQWKTINVSRDLV